MMLKHGGTNSAGGVVRHVEGMLEDPQRNSFLSAAELSALGLASFGPGCRISRYARLYSPGTTHLGHHVRIDDFCIISGHVELGNYVHIGPFSLIAGASGVKLDDFVGLSSRVAIYSESDDITGQSLTNPNIPAGFKPRYRRRTVLLKRHVGVGTASTILPGSVLAEGAALQAHTLFFGRAQTWSIYGGVPAKRISERKREILALEERFLEAARRAGDRPD